MLLTRRLALKKHCAIIALLIGSEAIVTLETERNLINQEIPLQIEIN